jgi:hypothetical protein
MRACDASAARPKRSSGTKTGGVIILKSAFQSLTGTKPCTDSQGHFKHTVWLLRSQANKPLILTDVHPLSFWFPIFLLSPCSLASPSCHSLFLLGLQPRLRRDDIAQIEHRKVWQWELHDRDHDGK